MRLIDADADKCRPYLCEYLTDAGMIAAQDAINAMPTVDAVPVVRCKDCKHWDTDWDIPVTGKGKCHYCPMTDLNTSADWYCADGEQKEDDT